MILTDTHTHLYLNQFDDDREATVQRAIDKGVRYMLLPNIDSASADPLLALCDKFPGHLFPMMGLHPTDVKENYTAELEKVEQLLSRHKFYAIGETGIDLYWDKTFIEEQKYSLRHQIALAKQHQLPVVLHVRESFDEIFEVIEDTIDENLTGVFHCFTGTAEQARRIIGWGFRLGIGGVLTFKNSGLDMVVKDIPMEHLLLETDSPFLAPKPFRGKRNESAYITYIAGKLATVKNMPVEEVADITTRNAVKLFGIPHTH
ncbi:MAG: TatD family hydrolase [Bacteroidales bacterium]